MRKPIKICAVILLLCIGNAEADWMAIDYPGASRTSVTDIDEGILVGTYWSSNGDSFGFLYDGTNWTSFDVSMWRSAAANTWITGIDGDTLVGFYTDIYGYRYGFSYSESSGLIKYNAPGATETTMLGIEGNNIVGYYIDAAPLPRPHGFIYDGTNWTILARTASRVSDIEGNTIVGWYENILQMRNHGLVYDGTNWTTLDVPGAT
ncbi:MAG: hypothetical protein ACYSWP_14140, partial [Planctomycetota bacterium]